MVESISWRVLVSLVGCPLLAVGCGDDGGAVTEDSSTGGDPTTSSSSSTSTTGSSTASTSTTDDTSSSSTSESGEDDSSAGTTGEPEGTDGTTGGADETSDASTGAPADESTGDSTGVVAEDGTESSEGGEASTGSAEESGSTGDPEDIVDTLDNPGFEYGETRVSLPGWTIEGEMTAAYVEYNNARTGYGRLGHWFEDPYVVSTFQTVGPIPNGTYSFRVWIARGDTFDEQFLFARGYSEADPTAVMMQETAAAGSSYTEVVLTDIPVTSGQVEVGIYSSCSAGGCWANIDDVEIVLQVE